MANRTQIKQAIALLLAPGQVTEIRALGVPNRTYRPRTISGYFDDPEALLEAACELDEAKAKGIYVIPNPVNPALLARASNRIHQIDDREPLTSDKDILGRRWLLVDVDSVRPAGISASEAEHADALGRALEIRTALGAAGWTGAILADSGNGAHLLYRIDLPVDDGGLVQRVLQSLAFRFSDERIQVDQSVYNPARIWKLYGTTTRKGDDTQERPHRLARIVEGYCS